MAALHQQVTEHHPRADPLGVLRPGARFRSGRWPPSSASSRVTLRQALRTLELEGLLKPRAGLRWVPPDRGSPVEEGATGLVRLADLGVTHGRAVSAAVLKLVTGRPTWTRPSCSDWRRARPCDELVRLRSLDGIPILVDHSLVPAALTPGLDQLDFRTEPLYRCWPRSTAAPVRPSARSRAAVQRFAARLA